MGEEQVDEPPSLLLADKRTLLANLIFCSALLRILSTWLGLGLGLGSEFGSGLGTLARHALWVMACGPWFAERHDISLSSTIVLGVASYLEHLRALLEAHRRHLLLAQREDPYHLLDVLDLVAVDGAAACGGPPDDGDEAPDALPHLVVGSAHWLYRLHATSDRQRQNRQRMTGF